MSKRRSKNRKTARISNIDENNEENKYNKKNKSNNDEFKVMKKEVEDKLLEEKKDLRESRKNRNKIKRKSSIKKFFIFNFIIGTICCYIGLIVVYGPSDKFRNWFITTAEASMRHKYYARWFYDENTIDYIMSKNGIVEAASSTDTSLYNMKEATETPSKITYKNEYERQILERDPNHPDFKIIIF